MARFFAPLALLAVAALSAHSAGADVISDAANTLTNSTAVADALKSAANATANGAKDAYDAAASAASSVVDTVSNISNSAASTIGDGVNKAGSTISDGVDKAGSVISDGADKASSLGSDAIGSVKNKTTTAPSPTTSAAPGRVASVVVVSLSAVATVGFTML